jgi:hypothetical protein
MIKNRCKSCYGGDEKKAANCKMQHCTLWKYRDAPEAPLKAYKQAGKKKKRFVDV